MTIPLISYYFLAFVFAGLTVYATKKAVADKDKITAFGAVTFLALTIIILTVIHQTDFVNMSNNEYKAYEQFKNSEANTEKKLHKVNKSTYKNFKDYQADHNANTSNRFKKEKSRTSS